MEDIKKHVLDVVDTYACKDLRFLANATPTFEKMPLDDNGYRSICV